MLKLKQKQEQQKKKVKIHNTIYLFPLEGKQADSTGEYNHDPSYKWYSHSWTAYGVNESSFNC